LEREWRWKATNETLYNLFVSQDPATTGGDYKIHAKMASELNFEDKQYLHPETINSVENGYIECDVPAMPIFCKSSPFTKVAVIVNSAKQARKIKSTILSCITSERNEYSEDFNILLLRSIAIIDMSVIGAYQVITRYSVPTRVNVSEEKVNEVRAKVDALEVPKHKPTRTVAFHIPTIMSYEYGPVIQALLDCHYAESFCGSGWRINIGHSLTMHQAISIAKTLTNSTGHPFKVILYFN